MTNAIMESDTLKGDRAFDRDLARHIPSRGERRRLRQKRATARMWEKREERILRAFKRVQAWALFESQNIGASWRHPIVLRSWKEASRFANPGGDIWLRARVSLKTLGPKRQRTLGGTLDANAARYLKVLKGEVFKAVDEKTGKVRYVNAGLARRFLKGNQAQFEETKAEAQADE